MSLLDLSGVSKALAAASFPIDCLKVSNREISCVSQVVDNKGRAFGIIPGIFAVSETEVWSLQSIL